MALARPPEGSLMPAKRKVDDWKVRHWANAHLLPHPPSMQSRLTYDLSQCDRVPHHLPSLHHQSEYTNPTLNLQTGPLLLHRYEIHNLQEDEKEAALRFLLVANAELRGLPLLSVKKEQEEDPVCAPLIARLQKGDPVKGFALFKGLLLCVSRQPALKLTLMLPQQLGAKYLAFLHESTAFFHLQANTLTRLAKKYFTIHQMSKLALKITQDCLLCQLHNRQSHKTAIRGKRFTVSAPRQLLYSDVCSFFTSNVNKSYMIIVDGFSFLTSAYALTTPETSDQLASHLIHYFSTHTTPSGICLDHASVHEGVLAQSLAILRVKKYQCSSRYPQPQLAERIHQYLIRILALLSSSFQVKEAHLPCLVSFAIHIFNSTPLRTMGDRSPYSIHFGDSGNATSCVPTIHVGPQSALPPYVKALARLQAATWQAVNDIKRKKEKKHLQGENPLRRPMFQPGDCVRMRNCILATAKNHKLAPSYSRHIYKVIKVLPKSGNYILLKLSDKNYLTHGFHTKQPLPKSCLTWAKESRLKKCSFRAACPDSLPGKLFAIFSDVAFRHHPVSFEFQNVSNVGHTVSDDAQLKKLSNFVLSKDSARVPRSNKQLDILADSEFGKIPGPSISQVGDAQQTVRHRRIAKNPSRIQLAHRNRAASFDKVVGKILPPDLAQLYMAAGCKQSLDDHNSEDDGDDGEAQKGGRPLVRQGSPQPGRPTVGQGIPPPAPPPPQQIPHVTPAQPALGARPKERLASPRPELPPPQAAILIISHGRPQGKLIFFGTTRLISLTWSPVSMVRGLASA